MRLIESGVPVGHTNLAVTVELWPCPLQSVYWLIGSPPKAHVVVASPAGHWFWGSKAKGKSLIS